MRLLNYIPFIAFIIVAIILYRGLSITSIAPPKSYVHDLPNFKLKLLTGGELDLKALNGRFYAIHLFASWCQYCKNDYPLLAKLKKTTQIPIIGIAIKDKINKLSSLKKYTTPYDYIAIDQNKEIAKLLNNRVLPETIIVNPEGIVIFHYVGVLSKEEIENNVIPRILEQ